MRVWVEMGGIPFLPVRIFRSQKAAIHLISRNRATDAIEMDRSIAVASIRHQIFIRSKGFCDECGAVVNETSGQMHEREWRGKGGEISLENSIFICAKCHKREHRERAPQFTRRQYD